MECLFVITCPKPYARRIWLSLRPPTTRGSIAQGGLFHDHYDGEPQNLLERFFSSFARRPSRMGLSRRRPPLPRGARGGPRPLHTAQGSSGGVDIAQSRREGPPAYPLRHGQPCRGTTGSRSPGDGKRACRGGRGFPPCKSRYGGCRGRKCRSLAGLRVRSAPVMCAQLVAQTRPPDRHIGSRPSTLWPAPGGSGGCGSWRRRVVAAAPLPWHGFPPSTCDSAWARMA